VPEPDVMIDTIRTIDEIFIRLAEADLGRQHLPLDDVVEQMWTALESGNIHLTVSGKRLHVAPFVGGARGGG
jgi:hypothetical protein